MALKLADLGVIKSHSRPWISDDNPFSESQFKTMKCRPEFPDRFGSLEDFRAHGQVFFHWYNLQHHHNGIAILTPHMVHYGLAADVLDNRQRVLTAVFQQHPERFVRKPPQPAPLPDAAWINPPKPGPPEGGETHWIMRAGVSKSLTVPPVHHRAIRRRVEASQDFRSFCAARRTIAGYEAVNTIRKGQARRAGKGDGRPATASGGTALRTDRMM